MVAEVRRLSFSDIELLAALSAVMRQRGEQAPDGGRPSFIHGRDGDGQAVTLLVYNDEQGVTLATFSFSAAEIGAALVLYCIQGGIPLPRRLPKRVQMDGSRIILNISDGPADDMAASAKEPDAEASDDSENAA